MNDKQREVMQQVENLLIEHFDGYVIITDLSDINDKGQYSTQGSYNGGIALAMGLCMYQLEYLKKKIQHEVS